MRCVLAAVWLLTLLMAAPAGPAGSIATAVAARSMQPGELVVLTMTVPEAANSVRLQPFNREIPVYRVDAVTWRGLIGIDLNVRPASYAASAEARSGAYQLQGT